MSRRFTPSDSETLIDGGSNVVFKPEDPAMRLWLERRALAQDYCSIAEIVRSAVREQMSREARTIKSKAKPRPSLKSKRQVPDLGIAQRMRPHRAQEASS
jgi:hypothetical protein